MPARSIAALLLTCLLTSPVAYAAPPKKPVKSALADVPTSDSATITVSSLTRGAKVFLNDEEVGIVPMKGPLRVKAGETYAIRVQKRGYAPYVDTVMADGGRFVYDPEERRCDTRPV